MVYMIGIGKEEEEMWPFTLKVCQRDFRGTSQVIIIHNLEILFVYQPTELRIPELGPLITTIATFMERTMLTSGGYSNIASRKGPR